MHLSGLPYEEAPQQKDVIQEKQGSRKKGNPLRTLPGKAITLRPLKAVGNLQQRYPEATADVVFVGRERLPAHRAVLSVASAVFFKMFEGDWRESRERSIPAPTEYKWEAFKAAITLLYGVEVQVDESSILDVYRVAHCYDLGYVKVVLAHAISQWGADMLDTAVGLCTLAGQLETEEAQKEQELIAAGVEYIAKHLAIMKANPTGLNALSYTAMLKLVQSEDISVPEIDVFLLLNQWMEGQLDITVRQAQQLYSHIRYGSIPYEFLSLGINQENRNLILQNHQQLSIDRLKSNLKQVTPRLCQNEVLQVYPLVAGLSVSRKSSKWEFVDVTRGDLYAVGVIFSGRQEFPFRLHLNLTRADNCRLHTQLSSVSEESSTGEATGERILKDQILLSQDTISLSYLDIAITLKSTGAFLVLESHNCSDCSGYYWPPDKYVSVTSNLPFKGPFPWLLKIGVSNGQPVSMVLHCE